MRPAGALPGAIRCPGGGGIGRPEGDIGPGGGGMGRPPGAPAVRGGIPGGKPDGGRPDGGAGRMVGG